MLCPFGVERQKTKKYNLDKKQIIMVVKREKRKDGGEVTLFPCTFVMHNKVLEHPLQVLA